MASRDLPAGGSQAKRAVAIKYDHESEDLPRIVAKGMGALAELIERLAESHGVPISRNDELAQLLASSLPDVDDDSDEYKIVAEIICYLYHLESSFLK